MEWNYESAARAGGNSLFAPLFFMETAIANIYACQLCISMYNEKTGLFA